MTAFEVGRPSLREVPAYSPDATSCAIDLRDNANLWGAPPAALSALRSIDPTVLSLYPGVSAGTLTDAIATFVGVGDGEVAAGCGSDDLIDAAFRAVAEPGAVIAYPAPSFSMVPIFARLNGLQPVAVPLMPDGAADADAMIATGARIIYLCSPNNPTGTITPADVVRRIVRESTAIVMLDGAYAEFAPDIEDLLKEAPSLERLLVLRTFSKAWGLAGLRIGYAVGSSDLIRAVRKSNGPYKVNAPAERAACVALAEDADWMRARAADAVVSRQRVTEALRAMGFAPLDSRGNFVCVPVPDARALAGRLAERGVAVRAFAGLPVFGDALRVGMGPWPVMEQFISALREALA
jgi:histidinol-phosphate aminotransferase